MTTHASTDQSSPAGPRTMTGEKGFIDEVTRAAISDRLEQIGLQAQQRSAAYSAQAAVLWSAGLQSSIRKTAKLGAVIGRGSGEAYQLALSGHGIVVVQASEGHPVVQQ